MLYSTGILVHKSLVLVAQSIVAITIGTVVAVEEFWEDSGRWRSLVLREPTSSGVS